MLHELQTKYSKQIEEIVEVCHQLARDKYVASHGGNVSMAADRPEQVRSNILITRTKKAKSEVEFEDICIVDYDGITLYAPPGGKPTGELPFHKFIFKERPDVKSIVHAHPDYTTSFVLTKNEPNYLAWPFLPEAVVELGPVCMVPYAEPITDKLAQNFAEFLPRYDAFLMENHGITVVGREGVERTRQLVDIIEITASQITHALARGAKLKPLTLERVEGLENTRKTRTLALPGIPGSWQNLMQCYEQAYMEIDAGNR